jgi:hypothetical protein
MYGSLQQDIANILPPPVPPERSLHTVCRVPSIAKTGLSFQTDVLADTLTIGLGGR